MRQRSTCPAAISNSGSLRPLITRTLPSRPLCRSNERGLRDVAVAIELHVVEHQQAIRVEHRLVGPEDDQRAVEPALDLHRLVRMRVVPEGACVGQLEAVVEGVTGLDEPLHQLGAVHRRGQAQPVPVDARGLGQVVHQVRDERVADVGDDRRPRDRALVAPGRDRAVRRDRPGRLARLEVDVDLARLTRAGLRDGSGRERRGAVVMGTSKVFDDLDPNGPRRSALERKGYSAPNRGRFCEWEPKPTAAWSSGKEPACGSSARGRVRDLIQRPSSTPTTQSR